MDDTLSDNALGSRGALQINQYALEVAKIQTAAKFDNSNQDANATIQKDY